MAAPEVLRAALATWTPPALGRLLEQRPDTLRGVSPRDLADLAERLWQRHSLVDVTDQLTLPHLQVLEAAASLGDGCDRVALAELLSGDGPGHDQAVERALAYLGERAIIAEFEDGRVAMPDAIVELLPDPLGLGQPAAVLLRRLTGGYQHTTDYDRAGHYIGQLTVEQLRTLHTRLGVPKQKSRSATVQSVIDFYADPDNIRALLDRAPPDVLDHLAGHATDPDDDGPWPSAGGAPLGYAQPRWQHTRDAELWAIEHGLMISAMFGHDYYGYGLSGSVRPRSRAR